MTKYGSEEHSALHIWTFISAPSGYLQCACCSHTCQCKHTYLIIEKHDLIYITRTLKNVLLLSEYLDRRLYLKDGCNNCDIIHWLKPGVFWRLPSFFKKNMWICASFISDSNEDHNLLNKHHILFSKT